MPEGDTVLRTARRLHQALAGRPLNRTELRWPTLGGADLAGRTVIEVTAHGKHILTRIAAGDDESRRVATVPAGPLTLHSHLRMDGSWTLHATGTRPWPGAGNAAVRAVLAGQDWTAVGVKLGMLDLVATADEPTLIGHLGPDIMTDRFPVDGLPESLRRIGLAPERTIGAALLDQTNVAGIGTFYMAEALFVQRLSPWTPVAEVDLGAVLATARRQLINGASAAIPSTTGETAKGRTSFVHARSGRPCRRCGGTVRVAPVGEPPLERTAFYCAVCQPGPTPTDPGRLMRPLGSSPRRPGSSPAAGVPRPQ